jgi:TonB family protein
MRSSYVPSRADMGMSTARPPRLALVRRHVAALAAGASVATHLVLAFSLDRVPKTVREVPPAPHEIAVIEAPPEKPEPPRAPEPPPPPTATEPPPPPPPSPRLDPAPSPAAPPPPAVDDPYDTPPGAPATAPPPGAPAILTAEGGGWSTNGSGAGTAGSGSSGDGRGRKEAPAAVAAAPPAPAERVVALGDLSRAPAPPSLDGALKRLYPDEARREGRSGDATVRARVGPSGAIVELRIDRASDAAFGQACRTLLSRSRWSPPLDREGKPVSTWIRYTCRFNADR